MTENKEHNVPFNPDIYEDDSFVYPSDRLTLRDLRRLWPDSETLGERISAIREGESRIARCGYLDGQPDPNPPKDGLDSFSRWAERDKVERDMLIRFYVETGLADGEHAASLFLRRIYDLSRKQSSEQQR